MPTVHAITTYEVGVAAVVGTIALLAIGGLLFIVIRNVFGRVVIVVLVVGLIALAWKQRVDIDHHFHAACDEYENQQVHFFGVLVDKPRWAEDSFCP